MTEQTVPVIDLVHPMPGFPDDHRFALVDLDGSGQLCSLTSLDHDGLRFLVAPPTTFFPDYAPEIDDATSTSPPRRTSSCSWCSRRVSPC